MKYAELVHGNLAYDAPLVRTPEVEAQPEEQEQQRVRIQTEVRSAPRQALSPLAILGGLCFAALAVAIILSYIALSDISEQTVELNAQMEELVHEESRLEIQYESAFDLTEVEHYAMSELGMVKAGEHQLHYIANEVPDKAVIVEVEEDGGLWGSIKRFFSRLTEYFR